ncbi:hypothetical protein [Bacillus anthracis]|uniref:Uncharacterized protein pXO2-21/BXB0020/GBAA_pXO2_0020 n=1 Tax=Bacillus anthracis TaxID=1392 RepID=Y6520_BACAN|nr:hypothetical protein [Bacillus anthracis]Q6F056.1 RecName: Full=Uncharacterized protein pXO2-21/BXB0020/GBAA_pXO2_0020 [Bacillus anthracis]AAM26180.1 hypothetical protein BX_B0020 [Bacillus anthracis str. A2012]EJT17342.1 hypothetical protein B353_30163 [Bacillus anthracis str. UR-1]AAT28950.2 hypothetical protein, (pXO2-21) [Bacillus anthracis str. 'Ames Ancestor']ACP12005.1 hypothetical protein BAMEG_B0017 [Bacillus anthracis str. CDC 684]ACQ45900.1 hypothetical protein BAA_B0020 [Bacill
MLDSSIMLIVKWFVGLMLIMMMVAVSLFCIQLSDVNLYKQQVNYQIERHGGLTKEAGAYLKDYSEKQYQGALSVKSDQLNKKVNFGDVVDYQVVANLKIILFNLPDVEMKFHGSATSQVR